MRTLCLEPHRELLEAKGEKRLNGSYELLIVGHDSEYITFLSSCHAPALLAGRSVRLCFGWRLQPGRGKTTIYYQSSPGDEACIIGAQEGSGGGDAGQHVEER